MLLCTEFLSNGGTPLSEALVCSLHLFHGLSLWVRGQRGPRLPPPHCEQGSDFLTLLVYPTPKFPDRTKLSLLQPQPRVSAFQTLLLKLARENTMLPKQRNYLGFRVGHGWILLVFLHLKVSFHLYSRRIFSLDIEF